MNHNRFPDQETQMIIFNTLIMPLVKTPSSVMTVVEVIIAAPNLKKLLEFNKIIFSTDANQNVLLPISEMAKCYVCTLPND